MLVVEDSGSPVVEPVLPWVVPGSSVVVSDGSEVDASVAPVVWVVVDDSVSDRVASVVDDEVVESVVDDDEVVASVADDDEVVVSDVLTGSPDEPAVSLSPVELALPLVPPSSPHAAAAIVVEIDNMRLAKVWSSTANRLLFIAELSL